MSEFKPTLFTCFSPNLLHLYDVSDTIVVIIDVFRATSTIAAALKNGAKCVIPVDTVAKAVELSRQIDGIAAGERDGKIADGLAHGNSPLEYHPSFIEGKILVLTTTNGTRLLHMALENGADAIITGSFPNLDAVCKYLIEQKKNVLLGCAGWKDRYNLEDTLFAGAVIEQVRDHFSIHCDSSLTAELLYRQQKERLPEFVSSLTHYHRLVERFGLIEDIRFCITPNGANVLPIYRDGKLLIEPTVAVREQG
ncbi:MAG: 2-phosphosulfolactate phosphatase [Chitinophagaceae bacterium]|nr:2-phosphosulfolactate phosphatase [Chitinophagaceae bacterium]